MKTPTANVMQLNTEPMEISARCSIVIFYFLALEGRRFLLARGAAALRRPAAG